MDFQPLVFLKIFEIADRTEQQKTRPLATAVYVRSDPVNDILVVPRLEPVPAVH